MGSISLGFTVCILSLLCSFVSPTPLENGPTGHLPQAPQNEPRDDVVFTKYEIQTAVHVNPPYYNTQCKVGGCTFSYEVSGMILITFAAYLTCVVGVSFLLSQCATVYGLPFHTSQPSHRDSSSRITDVYCPYF